MMRCVSSLMALASLVCFASSPAMSQTDPKNPTSQTASPDAEMPRGATPQFGDVRTPDALLELAEAGQLVPIYIFPTQLGGARSPENMIFVPPGVDEAQANIIGTLGRFAEDDVINTLTVEPVYHKDSLVPVEIVYRASHTERERRFTPTLVVWVPEDAAGHEATED